MDARFAGLLWLIGGEPIRGSHHEDYVTQRSATILHTTHGTAGRLVQHGDNMQQVPKIARVIDPKEMFNGPDRR